MSISGKVVQAIGSTLDAESPADKQGALILRRGRPKLAVLPLDDGLLDYLLETNPRFIAQCQTIREEVRAGKYYTQQQVERMFGIRRRSARARRETAR